jgi:uncharacterized protein YodC (DUF2158 family)
MTREEAEQKFPKGARVQLNIGGPQMVVKNYVPQGGFIGCQWFAGKKLDQGQFAHEALVRVEEGTEDPKS